MLFRCTSAIVVLAVASGCVNEGPVTRATLSEKAGQTSTHVTDDCPYRTLFVFWEMNPATWSERDRYITAQAGQAFARAMTKRGFRIAGDHERSYWLTYNQAEENAEAPGSFVWMAHTQALNDAQGRYHLGYALGGERLGTGVVAYYGLFQWTIADLESGADEMAEQTSRALLGHMVAMCDDWSKGGHAEEQRLERIRQDLADEVQRVRDERARRDQRRELELKVEDHEKVPVH